MTKLVTIGTDTKTDVAISVVEGKLHLSFDNDKRMIIDADQISVNVPVTDYDIDLFKNIICNNHSTDWVMEDKLGNPINLTFMSKDEYNQRNQ